MHSKEKKISKTSLGGNVVWQIFGLPFALIWFLLGVIAYIGVVGSLPVAIWYFYESNDIYTTYEKVCMLVLGIYFTLFGPLLGSQCMKISKFTLWPFGRDIKTQLLNKPRILIGNLFWHISGRLLLVFLHLILEKETPLLTHLHFHMLGMPLFVAFHLGIGFLFYLTVIFIPFGQQLFKVVQLCFLPFGAQVFIPSQKKTETLQEEKTSQEE